MVEFIWASANVAMCKKLHLRRIHILRNAVVEKVKHIKLGIYSEDYTHINSHFVKQSDTFAHDFHVTNVVGTIILTFSHVPVLSGSPP